MTPRRPHRADARGGFRRTGTPAPARTRLVPWRGLVDRLEQRTLLSGTLSISEFQASNTSTLPDSAGQYNDWIEIHNSGATPASLAGYALTDDPALPQKWVFPDVAVPADGYVVVFASGKDRRVAGQELHTNFNLNGDGEYLALVEPGGATKATEFAPAFPNQPADVSYGFDPASAGGRALRFFATPTPGAANVRSEVVINEIHYDPDVKTQLVEFVELHNPGGAPVDLGGAAFSSGVDYAFPAGATLPAGGYLVLAQNAAQFQAKFGTPAFGQYDGSLSNDGETVTLRNRSGGQLDTVDYRPGFPWPTVGDAPGYSIELINPDFDNSVGGNWRAHVAAAQQETTLLPAGSTWKYLKGTDEASDPVNAWRLGSFNDAPWNTGGAPVGYDAPGGVTVRTSLDDMRNSYTSVFMRTTFDVADPRAFSALRLEALADDGFIAWINGNLVASFNVPSNEMPNTGTATSTIEDNTYKPYSMPTGALRAGSNVIAVQFFNVNIGTSGDAFFDGRVIGTIGGGGVNPTPGRRNSVFADNAAPAMRHVENTPQQPKAGEVVTVTSLVTDPDGVAGVTLKYQPVDPGNYINIDDAAYQTNWTSVAMKDDGTGGDVTAGDGLYTAQLPASVQTNRRLVRYRVTATDSRGASITAPYADDSVPNFAYYVYDGVPGWSGAAQPGVTPVVNYGADVMNGVAAYQLIAKNSDVEDATWWSKYGGDSYLWKGTLVYDGVVYDHVSFRMRGGVWRYAMVKNMWKFDFNHNHGFQARDDYGNKYETTWDKLNLGAAIQQGDFGHRGEQGLFESVGFKLFNLAGVDASNTNFVQFRVVDAAAETGPTQYDGDLWGLYLAVEQPDGNFLDEHDMPDGNLYKMEGGSGELNNQGATQPTNKSDLTAFMAGYQKSGQTDQWFRDNMDLDSYYGYRTILEGIHHYDIDETAGKNYFFYHDPQTNKWQTVPWDLDLTWADNMYGGGNEPFKNRIPVSTRPVLQMEYRNRIREIRDLLFNADQGGQVIDEMAAKIYTPGAPSFVDVDRAMWDYNPHMASPNGESSAPSKAGQGRFYQIVANKQFSGMIQKMKAYVVSRGSFLDNLARDAAIPAQPAIAYAGAAGFPGDGLRFHSSAFSDPDGAGTFAAMEWRLAEVTNPSAPGYDPKAPKKYEINADWESGELSAFNADVSIPANIVVEGRTYRVRVRMKDATGRWSNWSAPAQFVAGKPVASVKDSLRITEMNYHPAPNPAGGPAEDEYEFVELQNTGAVAINLRGAHFTHGLSYTFDESVLQPGEYVVVAVNRDAFISRYGTVGINLAPGAFTGHLDNTGERVRLVDAAGDPVQDFIYSDNWYPSTDGDGPTLVIADPREAAEQWSLATGWQPSVAAGGSPGAEDSSVDTRAPVADIVDVAPNPRTTPVDSVTIAFSEPVTGFDITDLRLHLAGDGANLLTGAQTLRTTDNVVWTLGNLAGITGAEQSYVLQLIAPGGIADAAGNALAAGASMAWSVDTHPPTADVVDVAPDPRTTAVDTLKIIFSKPVTGFETADLSLTRGGAGTNLLTAAQTLRSDDGGRTWTLANLGGITGTAGAYALTLRAAGSGIADAAGNPLAGDASDAWVVDRAAPTADIIDVAPDPRNAPVNSITIVFSEPVTGFDLSDLMLHGPAGADVLTADQTLTSADGITWVLGNLAPITGKASTYQLMFLPLNGITDAAGNAFTGLPEDFWTNQVLTGRFVPVSPNPRGTPVDSIDVVFTSPVTGFDLSDLRLLSLTGNGNNLLTAAQTLTTADRVHWTIGNLGPVTGPLGGGYMLSLDSATSGIADAYGNGLSDDLVEQWSVAAVLGRHVFYNNSAFDAAGNDDAAIADDKSALLPGGGPGAFANLTSYTRGINGIMIDLAGMPPGAVRGPNATDFAFKVGTGADRSAWAAAPAPASVSVRRGAGAGGSDRVTITWADGAIKNQWLEVTVKANDITGLSAPDVFTFGNLVGDTGDGAVNALDLGAVKRLLNATADLASRSDVNRDGKVNALDLGAVKNNLNRSLSLQAGQTVAPAAVFGTSAITAPSGLTAPRVWDEQPADLLHL